VKFADFALSVQNLIYFKLGHVIKVAQNSFQHFPHSDLMGRYDHSLSVDVTIVVSKVCPIFGQDVGIIFGTEEVTIITV